jgi:dTDP-4-dehydrorhamnose 3,5-epimerase
MLVIEMDIKGIFVLEPRVFADERGYFFESFRKDKFISEVCNTRFVQDNEAKSNYGVLRGLHFQKGEYAQAKLVRVVKGAVLDVAVDIREDSPTYGQHVAVKLTGENKKQMFIPRGFAHGYVVLEDDTIFSYKCDNLYAPNHEGGILYNDPKLNIDWIIPEKEIIVSEKDKKNPLIDHFS